MAPPYSPPARPHSNMLGILHPTSTHFNRSTSSSGSYMDASWAEDDAWDSASDSESPNKRPSTFTTNLSTGAQAISRATSSSSTTNSAGGSSNNYNNVTSGSRPVPVGRKPQNEQMRDSPSSNDSPSSSNLAFSYTHVNAPDPSSYPPKREFASRASSRDGRVGLSTVDSTTTSMTATTSTKNSGTAQKSGWTIVQTTTTDSSANHSTSSLEPQAGSKYTEEESDIMIVGDMEGLDLSGSIQSIDDSLIAENRFKSSQRNEDLKKIRHDATDIVNDPLHAIRSPRRRRPSPSPSPSPSASSSNSNIPSHVQASHIREKSEKIMRERSIRSNRKAKFIECLSSQDVNINELRKLAWAGIPRDLRPMAWQLLLGYLPLSMPSRAVNLARKREEYHSMVETMLARGREGLDNRIWHQIEKDVPRTRPGVRLWMLEATQGCLQRILYVWAIRHPASGYVQGINDLATPFFQVFMSAYIDEDPEVFDPSLLPKSVLDAIEADSFWCLSRLLDGIQDNYISDQPGIQRSLKRMQELVARIDPTLTAHLQAQNVEFMQFAFRWMNCLLMREISVSNTIRMWDTYLAEGADAFSQFHLYVCCAFLVRWSDVLKRKDFSESIMFLQSLPTQGWGDHEVEMLLSEAFVLNATWQNAQSHFNGK